MSSTADFGASGVCDVGAVFKPIRPVSDPMSFYPGFGHEVTTLKQGTLVSGGRWHGGTRSLPVDILFEKDIAVKLPDGATIYVDVFRPLGAEHVPAIVAWSPYGKEGGSWTHGTGPQPLAVQGLGGGPRTEWVSGLQKFEGPDPAEWVEHGYAIVNPDPRGAFMSEGNRLYFGEQEGKDGAALIEWVASQDWSNGRVATQGNSWLGIMQWFIAAQRPPHLAAMAPWEGFPDYYRDHIAIGGIPFPGFTDFIGSMDFGTGLIEDPSAMLHAHPLMNEYWERKSAQVERIDVPSYVVAHPNSHRTMEAFRRLRTDNKWLRIHNTSEWYNQYVPEYVADLRRFFDRYLKDDDNGWETTSPIRIALFDPGLPVEHSANKQYADAPGYMPARVVDRPENEWPLAQTQYHKLYLDTATGQLATELPSTEGIVKYLSTSPDSKASFTYQFEEDTELTGYFSLTLWVAAASANDMDLFVTVDKLDEHGNVLGLMNTGQLRVSHREIDLHRSTRFWPVYKHERQQFLMPGEIVPVEIGIAPSTMFWHTGQQLRLMISGLPPAGPNPFQPLVKNEGDHTIYGGGRYDSHLQVPVIPHMD